MILKGRQRAGGKALALHLLRTDENDHVHVHQVRGFIRNNVLDAFREAYAVSHGTKCKQYLFSLSLSPPSEEKVSVAAFEKAIDKIEMRLGLVGQPRAVVFHEKDGRRHAHCVWSRIDPKTMIARPMGHFKLKLTELSRDLYLEHGWKMPPGLAKTMPENPLNFSLAEWQQAKRIGRDPTRIKSIFKECWAVSDTGNAFRRALEERGYYLARGDRRGYVAVDWQSEIYSISRWCGAPTRLVEERLSKLQLPAVEAVREQVAKRVEDKLRGFEGELSLQFETARTALKAKRDALVSEQRFERDRLERRLAIRWQAEAIERANRLRKGLRGLWDWLTGRRARTIQENEREIERAEKRDALERQSLVDAQLKVRRTLQVEIKSLKAKSEMQADRVQSQDKPRMMTVPTISVLPRPGRYRKPDLRR